VEGANGRFTASTVKDGKSGDLIIKLVNGEADGRTVKVKLNGSTGILPAAIKSVLSRKGLAVFRGGLGTGVGNGQIFIIIVGTEALPILKLFCWLSGIVVDRTAAWIRRQNIQRQEWWCFTVSFVCHTSVSLPSTGRSTFSPDIFPTRFGIIAFFLVATLSPMKSLKRLLRTTYPLPLRMRYFLR
jgi:hypothetical protein